MEAINPQVEKLGNAKGGFHYEQEPVLHFAFLQFTDLKLYYILTTWADKYETRYKCESRNGYLTLGTTL